MAYALEPEDELGRWLRDVNLSIIRRSVEDWVGPWFRDHESDPRQGHLETAHLCIGVAAALDLVPEVFTESERQEVERLLGERGIPLCLRWLDRTSRLNNWRCIMNAGLAVASAVLDDRPMMDRAVSEYQLCTEAYQADGSYSESLQYGNYAALGLTMAYEALVRRDPSLENQMAVEAYARGTRWAAHSYFYAKPLKGWGQRPRPRSANFNDCAAIFRPSGDVLLHIATRAKKTLPTEAGLARWLFDTHYLPAASQGPFDRASFGLVNHFGFLTLPLLLQAAEPLSPAEAHLPTVAAFSNGDSIARDDWDGRTVLAVHGGGEPLYAPAHLHGDLNSFILVHNRERLLIDPGHSCYRNLMRELEISSQTHNTCTFSVGSTEGLRQEDLLALPKLQQQTITGTRVIVAGEPGPPVKRGGRRLLADQDGPVTVIGSEAGAVYGSPMEEFSRFCFLLGSHVLFVVDRIRSADPVRTTWNWLLNNRDDGLALEILKPDRVEARRGDAGLKLYHLGDGVLSGPFYAYVHDAYHPLPNQRGEGKPGSGLLMRWQEPEARLVRTTVHAIAVDDYGSIAGWDLAVRDGKVTFDGPGDRRSWTLELEEKALAFRLTGAGGAVNHRVGRNGQGQWELAPY